MCWGDNSSGQLGTGDTINWHYNSGGSACALVDVDVNGGTVQCWGSNNSGQLGNGGSGGTFYTPVNVVAIQNILSITAGFGHACARLTGAVSCWGYNFDGELGDAAFVDRFVPDTVHFF